MAIPRPHKGYRQRSLEFQTIQTFDALQKLNGFFVTSHKQMLPIIDGIARLGIDERIGPAAQDLAALQYPHAASLLCERGRRGESRESSADHNHVFHRFSHQAFVASHNFTGVGTRMRPSKTL